MKLNLFILLIFLSSCVSEQGNHKMKTKTVLPYGNHERQKGELCVPKSHNSILTLLVHGGAWSKRNYKDMKLIEKSLCSRGYIVYNINYRLSPEFNHPAPIDDLEQALSFIKMYLSDHHISVQKTALWGYSAGGHIVSLLALQRKTHKIDAVIAGGTPFNLSLYIKKSLVEPYIGHKFTDKPELYKEASPINYVTKESPSFFIYHAKDDDLVSPKHVDLFVSELKKNSVSFERHDVSFWGHITTFIFSRASVKKAITFLERELISKTDNQ